jgi:hypothetical protein
MQLIPSNETFTRDRLQELWAEALESDQSLFTIHDVRNQSQRAHCRDFWFNADGEPASEAERLTQLEELGARFVDAAGHGSDHFALIDSQFSPIFAVRFESSQISPADEALNLLRRMPPTPPEIDLSYRFWHGPELRDLREFFNPSAVERTGVLLPKFAWQELQTVTRFSTVTLRLALLVVSSPIGAYNVGSCIYRFLNVVSELLHIISSETRDPRSGDNPLQRDIVTVFLWATWTRCSILFFWFVLRNQIKLGYDDQWNQLLALRGTNMLVTPSIRATLCGWKDESSPYMCSWAFELLKVGRASLSLDFRHFHRRYADLHKGKPQRCLWDSNDACPGSHPLDCGRFQDRRLVADEQSVHACGENREHCQRLFWSRQSYISVQEPVVVSTKSPVGGIKYVRASAATMAISHVWSHGHGGRPHTGMNSCLHERFSRIAERHGCDSYWIDTLCIPDEHLLCWCEAG